MATTIVVMKKGHDRNEFQKHIHDHAPSWKPVEGLPRHFIIEGMHHSDFPHHSSLEGVHDGDAVVHSTVQTLNLTATLDQDNWALARLIRHKPPWYDSRITSPFSSYFYCNRDGTGVDYYAVDSGILTTHEQFGSRATFVYDFYGTFTDGQGHGTGTSSVAAGNTVGFARGALIWMFRALDNNGSGSNTAIVTALGQVLSHYNGRASTGRPAVLNMSFTGSTGVFDSAISDIIDAGIVCVAAAGNSKQDLAVHPVGPATITDVICAGGITMNDTSYFESGFGTNYGTPIDLCAPAYNIKTAFKGSNSTYNVWSGTSFAAPCVSGIIACMLQGYRRLTSRTQVQAVLTQLQANATTGYLVSTFGLTLPDKIAYIDPNVYYEAIDGLSPSTTQTIYETLPFYDDETVNPTSQHTINDTLSLLDTISSQLVTNTNLSDTLSFTELFNQTWVVELDETVTFTDTASALVWKIGNFTDAVTFTEELLNQFIVQRTISDPLEFADVFSKVMSRLVSLSDTVTFADVLDGVAVRVLGDTCTFTDVLSAVVAKVFKDVLEFGDSLNVNTVLKRSATDQLVLFDSLTYTAVLRKTLGDVLNFTDSILGFNVHPISDTLSLTDTASAFAAKPLADTLTFSEATTVNKVQNRSVTDTVAFTDSLTATKVLSQQILDTIDFLETAIGIRQRFGTMSDTLDLTDEQIREVHLGPLTDTLTFTETMSFNKNSTRELTETLEITDDLVVQTTLVRDWTDHLLFSEGFLAKIIYATRPKTPINQIQQATVPPLSPPVADVVYPSPVWEGVISVLPQVVLIGKTRTIVLPSPEFNDFKAGQGKIAVQRSMTGKFRVYAKRATREKLNWRFVIPKYKADEFRDFIVAEIDSDLNVIDWEGNYWNLKILSDSVDFVESRRWAPCGNAVEVTVELVGNRYA